MNLRAIFNIALLSVVMVFLVWNLSPWLWFTDTTPTGGDLGAHVWSPAYLLNELLPNFRLAGWSPDWYAGFPAFTFYMVIPSLAIVIVNVGIGLSADIFSAIGVGLAAFAFGKRFWPRLEYRMLAAAWIGGASVAFGAIADGRFFATDALGWSPLEPVGYNDTAVDLAIAALILPAMVGRIVWKYLTGDRERKAINTDALETTDALEASKATLTGKATLAGKASEASLAGKAKLRRFRGLITAACVIAVVLAVPMPYGVAIKLVVVSGLVTLPLAAFAAGRLAGLADPGPAVLALMTLPFIFDRSFNIYGGNLLSTMAGEFAYSMGLSVAVLFIGYAARGLTNSSDRPIAALLLALAGLLHLFTAFFALVAFAALLLVRFGWREIRWFVAVGSTAALLSAFWVWPFAWNVKFLNDMGWGKERRYLAALWHRGGDLGDRAFLANEPPLQLFVALAIVGLLFSLFRRVRLGVVLGIVAAVFAVAFVVLPESRLWNVRLLPFYYLSVYLLAGIGITHLFSSFWKLWSPSSRFDRRSGPSPSVAISLGLFACLLLFALALPLRSVPFASAFERTNSEGETTSVYGFPSLFGLRSIFGWSGLAVEGQNPGPGWLRYNFTGYEDKPGTDEYNAMVDTMASIGRSHGCGRALWEFESELLGTYGTTMAPMLLPHWTDGCIGSMEGLYFEASATTPYHFLLQSELSLAPSRAQRELPYSPLDVDKGIRGLQTLGVRYYMAFSEEALGQARSNEDLTEIAVSGPWVVFQVADQSLVSGLDYLPVVVEGLGVGGEEWLIPTVAAWESKEPLPLIAAAGPSDWPRMSLDDLVDVDGGYAAAVATEEWLDDINALSDSLHTWLTYEPIDAVGVSDVVASRDSLSFSVDRVGEPVLVRNSYFPNWNVTGASGPFRVSPNLMVVVPFEFDVSLSYGRSPIQVVGWLATISGIAALVFLGLRRFPFCAEQLPAKQEQCRPLWDFGTSKKGPKVSHDTYWVQPFESTKEGEGDVSPPSRPTTGRAVEPLEVREPEGDASPLARPPVAPASASESAREAEGDVSPPTRPPVAPASASESAREPEGDVSPESDDEKEAASELPESDGHKEEESEVLFSVVIPAFCEERRIASTISALRDAFAALSQGGGYAQTVEASQGGDISHGGEIKQGAALSQKSSLEIIVVDDGSTDETTRRAQQAGADLVIQRELNQGKGAAVRVGMLASKGKAVAFTDADLAYSPKQIMSMLLAAQEPNKMVIGNRYAEESQSMGRVSDLRRVGSRIVNLLARTVLEGDYQDTQSGCKAFNANLARTLMSASQIDGFAFDIELLHLAERLGATIEEVPVEVRNQGSSTVRAVSDGFKVARDINKIRILQKKGLYKPSPEET